MKKKAPTKKEMRYTIAADIRHFLAQCERDEYTDTGRALELLAMAATTLRN